MCWGGGKNARDLHCKVVGNLRQSDVMPFTLKEILKDFVASLLRIMCHACKKVEKLQHRFDMQKRNSLRLLKKFNLFPNCIFELR